MPTDDRIFYVPPTTTTTATTYPVNTIQWTGSLRDGVYIYENRRTILDLNSPEHNNMASEPVPLKNLKPIPLTANQLFCLRECLKKSFSDNIWVGLDAYRIKNVSVYLNTKKVGYKVLVPIEMTVLFPRDRFDDEIQGSNRIVFSSFFPVNGNMYETHNGNTVGIKTPVEFLFETNRLFVLNKCNPGLPIEFWIKD